jgi:GNAT superfamily N-acetyltransferase
MKKLLFLNPIFMIFIFLSHSISGSEPKTNKVSYKVEQIGNWFLAQVIDESTKTVIGAAKIHPPENFYVGQDKFFPDYETLTQPCYIGEFYVKEKYRHQGVGTKLWNNCLDHAAKQGYKQACWYAGPGIIEEGSKAEIAWKRPKADDYQKELNVLTAWYLKRQGLRLPNKDTNKPDVRIPWKDKAPWIIWHPFYHKLDSSTEDKTKKEVGSRIVQAPNQPADYQFIQSIVQNIIAQTLKGKENN